jgi:hypothetical protein
MTGASRFAAVAGDAATSNETSGVRRSGDRSFQRRVGRSVRQRNTYGEYVSELGHGRHVERRRRHPLERDSTGAARPRRTSSSGKYGSRVFKSIAARSAGGAPYSAAPIPASALGAGDVFGARTNGGHYAKVNRHRGERRVSSKVRFGPDPNDKKAKRARHQSGGAKGSPRLGLPRQRGRGNRLRLPQGNRRKHANPG